MLPITTRHRLKVPHHLAIVGAAVAVVVSLFWDVQHEISAPETTASTVSPTTAPPTQQSSQNETKLSLPRLFPWHDPSSDQF